MDAIIDSWLKYLQSGQNCKGDDEPGHSIIDDNTHSLAINKKL